MTTGFAGAIVIFAASLRCGFWFLTRKVLLPAIDSSQHADMPIPWWARSQFSSIR
jgi:hypothetical protein